ncbi:ketopantoate reductase family protein [Sporolactobacillus sp. THM19-2]|jgi:2-dehydropantoate 2-reductase|uniref:ketopantoate reductase family protein n=1 Tax=Sporolactobacillus sp. THM19-2 TaxID=2511171 RepID=UPI00102051BF|nr:ketopantoate reductase family protein [Sporolactobacillus sp. THM19-2]RYL94131.1 ketopantoate reductase family protein [Sporolactobacillus sp. THM19-2]
MKIVVIGAGAMGLRYGVLLQEAGNDVQFVDTWEQNVEAIKKNGGVVVTRDGANPHLVPVRVSYPEEYHETPELAIVFIKDMHTVEMMERCRHFIGKNTYVLTNQNGFGGAEYIAQFVDKEKIIAGTAMIATVMKGPGKVDFVGKRGTGHVHIVRREGKPDAFIYKVADEMEKALMHPTVKTDYLGTVWTKLVFNSVVNTLCTLMNIKMGQFAAYKNAEEMSRRLIYEAYEATDAEGIKLEVTRDELVEQVMYVSRVSNPLHYPSMHQDMSTNRPTEVDYINGAIVRLAEKHGLKAPYHSMLVDLVHLKEASRKYDDPVKASAG